MGYELVGRVWNPKGFGEYVKTLDLSWANGITMHHTAAPSLAQRPSGLKAKHLVNLKGYYKNELGWSRGPHLFIDDDQVWGLSSLEERGIHAKSFNRTHIGIEVLGDYDNEDAESGRGLACWTTAARAVSAILEHTWWSGQSINAHRDDPRTSKTCPGKNVDMYGFRAQVDALASDRTSVKIDDRGPDPIVMKTIETMEWQLAKLRRLVG